MLLEDLNWWRDSMDQDIRLLGVRNWKNLALNREE
jgi:hypothetical protein